MQYSLFLQVSCFKYLGDSTCQIAVSGKLRVTVQWNYNCLKQLDTSYTMMKVFEISNKEFDMSTKEYMEIISYCSSHHQGALMFLLH